MQVSLHKPHLCEELGAQGCMLDSEAQARGTTVYLVDRRLDMLPSLLSEHLCSLVGNTDRLAVSVMWTLNSNLEVQSTWFGRTVIRCLLSNLISATSPLPLLAIGAHFRPCCQELISSKMTPWPSPKIFFAASILGHSSVKFEPYN